MSRSPLSKAARRARRELKHVRLRLRAAPPARHPLVHIVGCQRSGTTMLTELLDRDSRIRVHGELESLFDDVPRHHRLRELDDVRSELSRTGAAIDVVKPLVESHRVAELLGLAPGAIAVWMFRRYEDVAASNLRRFGVDNGVRNLQPIVDDDRHDWRNAGIDPPVRDIVRSLFDVQMLPHDAAALFWYCRNTLLHRQALDGDDRVRTCRYEHLVAEPAETVRALYSWVGLDDPPSRTRDDVHTESVGKGRAIEISPRVRELCDQMWHDLTSIDANRGLMVAGRR